MSNRRYGGIYLFFRRKFIGEDLKVIVRKIFFIA